MISQQSNSINERRERTSLPGSLAKKRKNTPFSGRDEPYSNFIWELARRFTNTPEEAEAAVREMDSDIRHCGEDTEQLPSDEDILIDKIAWRRLIRFLK